MTDEANNTDTGAGQAEVVANAEPVKEREFVRFSLLFRLQHIGMLVSCLTLMITGIPLKYADTRWATAFFNAVGGVEVSGVIHRVGAAVLIAVGAFHLVYTVAVRDGRYNFMELLPKVKDVTDVFHNVLYFFGFAKGPPKFNRFAYFEKFDYWAVYWGMVIMIGSGLILWFNTKAMALLPKIWMDVAHEAHSDEGLLATLAIVVWHFYNVHFNPDHWPGNLTWWNGRVSERKMKHHHGAEYERLMALMEQRAPLEPAAVGPEPIKAESPEPEMIEAEPSEPQPVLPEETESDPAEEEAQ
jgi:cytochrome b subunit of formate dehydrogenase